MPVQRMPIVAVSWSCVPRSTSLTLYRGLFLLALAVSRGIASEDRTDSVVFSALPSSVFPFSALLFSYTAAPLPQC